MVEGKKFDIGKLEWHLLPRDALKEVIRVLMHGKKLYGAYNWMLVENARERYYDAACRHLHDWYDGKKYDKDSKLLTLAHVACCVLFLLWFEIKGWKKPGELTKGETQ
jgi:hypothetical protein